MTVANYKPSLSLTLAHEGGYSNHPKDPGGATMKGVTQRVYDAYRRLKGRPVRSVRLIEAAELDEIYNRNYWRLVRGDELPAGLDYAMFDFAVNSGVSRAVKTLQTGLGFTGNDVDGIIGDRTLGRVFRSASVNEELLITSLCDARMAFLKRLGTFDTFGKGWTRRVMGDKPGPQPDIDKGVIDYAVAFARRDPIYVMPSPIGSKPGEVAGRGSEPIGYLEAQAQGWGIK